MRLSRKKQAELGAQYDIIALDELAELRRKAKLTELPPPIDNERKPEVGFRLVPGVLLLVAVHALAGLIVSFAVWLRNR